MTLDDLMHALQSLAMDMRRWERRKWELDQEHPIDHDRPATKEWGDDFRGVLAWRQDNEQLLVQYRSIVARYLKRKPSQQWTAEDMIELLGESQL